MCRAARALPAAAAVVMLWRLTIKCAKSRLKLLHDKVLKSIKEMYKWVEVLAPRRRGGVVWCGARVNYRPAKKIKLDVCKCVQSSTNKQTNTKLKSERE